MAKRSEYLIPSVWDCWGYDGPVRRYGAQVAVAPRGYFDACVDWIGRQSSPVVNYSGRSLSKVLGVKRAGAMKVRDGRRVRRGGDWIKAATMYGAMIRTSTAWDHRGDGRLGVTPVNDLGTFLKTILLLPHLARMGVNVLYLLPVVKVSHLYRKGELGCPYSAKNFFELDPDQYDRTLGGGDDNIEAQFSQFVECAHGMGMRVMLDLAPRTAARDNDWILDHPQWFYWTAPRYARNLVAPRLPGVEYINAIPGRLNEVYDHKSVHQHLAKFRFGPHKTHPQKWANFVKSAKRKPPKNLLADIGKQFGVVTPPGFSDCINDDQPPWSDVTYLRLYEDHPKEAADLLPDPAHQAPYVLFDTAKASNFPGKKPQKALWNQLADILPFYQKFGVDGARIDMAHALPQPLERMILDRPRKIDPDFCFLAEELGTHSHKRQYDAGYNIIIGPSWYQQPRSSEGRMHGMVAELPKLKVPVMAAAETPDTPRAVVRSGGRRFAKHAVVLNNFLPNAVPMICGGMEVFERQPMNLGLDNVPPGRDALPAADPLAGKLAFFDRYALHWDNRSAKGMIDLIARAADVRMQYIDAITNPRAYFAPKVTVNQRWVLATGFRLPRKQGSLLAVANVDFKRGRRTKIGGLAAMRTAESVLNIVETSPPRLRSGALTISLGPGDVRLIVLGA